jgi:hypothetical protein
MFLAVVQTAGIFSSSATALAEFPGRHVLEFVGGLLQTWIWPNLLELEPGLAWCWMYRLPAWLDISCYRNYLPHGCG